MKTDLLQERVQAALVIPKGWSQSLANGDPKPLKLYLDGADTNTAQRTGRSLQKTLGKFQLAERQEMIDSCPRRSSRWPRNCR